MILVTGAAGKTGKAIIRALVARRMPVRALVRRVEQVQAVQALGATELLLGDMRDSVVMQRALLGASAVYHICPNMSPDELAIGQLIIKAAQQAAVTRFVYHSVLHPQIEAMPHHWLKMRVEEALLASGLTYTILQPAAYMQNLRANWNSVVELGRLCMPYPPDARVALVDLVDVADVAALLLAQPGHGNATYELVGEEGLSQHEVANVMGQTLGRTVSAEEIPLLEWRKQAVARGLPPSQREMLEKMFRYYGQVGMVGNSWALRQLLGGRVNDLAAYLRRLLEDGAHEE